jgi:hypothetical protein
MKSGSKVSAAAKCVCVISKTLQVSLMVRGVIVCQICNMTLLVTKEIDIC